MQHQTRATQETYEELQRAYDWFNAKLFSGALPGCLITLTRKKRTYGYYSASRFGSRHAGHADELSMNPAYFAVTSVEEVMSTVVHEMVHQWQRLFGKPGRRRYHNREFAEKMKLVGLMASQTGKPGGSQVGEQMDHFILPDGPFIRACRELITSDFRLSWYDRLVAEVKADAPPSVAVELFDDDGDPIDDDDGDTPSPLVYQPPAISDLPEDVLYPVVPTSNRVKYTCEGCCCNVWGKPALNIQCVDCDQPYLPN